MRWWVLVAFVGVGCGGQSGDDSSAIADAGSDTTFADAASDTSFDDVDIGDGGCPTPASVDAFAPTPILPPHVAKGACTSGQIDDAFESCFPPTTCEAFEAANPTCASCLFWGADGGAWGPLVPFDSGVYLNATACIETLTGDSSETSCAQRFDDVVQCGKAACDEQCPIDPQNLAAREQCYGNADKTVCGAYVANECASDAGWAATCIAAGSNDPEADFESIAGVMCGP